VGGGGGRCPPAQPRPALGLPAKTTGRPIGRKSAAYMSAIQRRWLALSAYWSRLDQQLSFFSFLLIFARLLLLFYFYIMMRELEKREMEIYGAISDCSSEPSPLVFLFQFY